MRIDLDEGDLVLLGEIAQDYRELNEVGRADLAKRSEYVQRLDVLNTAFIQLMLAKVFPKVEEEQGEFVFGAGPVD